MGAFGSKHLHGHLAVVFQVLGEIDRRHPTATELPLDGIAIGEGGFQTVNGVGHGAASPASSTTKMWRGHSGGQTLAYTSSVAPVR